MFYRNQACQGAAIHSTSCNMKIEDASFVNNTAVLSGGAIVFDVSVSDIDIDNVIITGNRAVGAGGAVAISGGNIYIHDSIISENVASEGIGGGILLQIIEGFLDNDTRITIENSVIIDNFAAINGGGIAVEILSATSTSQDLIMNYMHDEYLMMNIFNVTMSNNVANNCGGGVYLNYGSIKMISNMILSNYGKSCGGGLCIENGLIHVISDIWDRNSAGDFGGALVTNSQYIKLINVSIINNSAKTYGAGVYFEECPMDISKGLIINGNIAGQTGNGWFISDEVL